VAAAVGVVTAVVAVIAITTVMSASPVGKTFEAASPQPPFVPVDITEPSAVAPGKSSRGVTWEDLPGATALGSVILVTTSSLQV
jgi:hypothetical protein